MTKKDAADDDADELVDAGRLTKTGVCGANASTVVVLQVDIDTTIATAAATIIMAENSVVLLWKKAAIVKSFTTIQRMEQDAS
jgi:hypothetical protein